MEGLEKRQLRYHRVVAGWLVKAETAIPGYNEQSVSHLILLAHLIGKCMKVPVDVSADNHAFRFRIFKQFAHDNSPITRN